MVTVGLTYDEALVWDIAARFDLREPNRRALDAVVQALVNADGNFVEVIADLATGVGKTFLMSALVEYVATQGVRHVLVVTPGSTIQRKTLANFDAASAKYVAGADIVPFVITPDNFRSAVVGAALRDPTRLKVFVFNVQQLIRPTANVSRKVRTGDEHLGDALYDHLKGAGDLLVIADEHHVYHPNAAVFHDGVHELDPFALVGLTATPHREDYDKVVFQYTLGEAIADGHVKTPVIVYRKDGSKDERTQLADACNLLRHKESAYEAYRAANPDVDAVRPVLFVVCQSVEHASEVGVLLSQDGFIGDGAAVLEVTSKSSDTALEALAGVDDPGSPIRAVVSVNMLKEGWDVKRIAVIVALRRLASQMLTEQILGRGLRLPFGARTGVADVDQVDLVAHDSYEELLAQKDILAERVQPAAPPVEVDESGAATVVELSGSIVGGEVPGGGLLEGLGDEETAVMGGDGDDEPVGDDVPALVFEEVDARLVRDTPCEVGRVEGAPQVVFPQRVARMVPVAFSLSNVADVDARTAGGRFSREVPTFIFRDALVAHRDGDDVKVRVSPQEHDEVSQPLAGVDVVRAELELAILSQPEVPNDAASRGGAHRLVDAFLQGAGVTPEDGTAEWGDNRRRQAVEGIRAVIRAAVRSRKTVMKWDLSPAVLPVEPVLMSADVRDAWSDRFVKYAQFGGWRKCVMPVASFDARSTEFEFARLVDRDGAVAWWLRLYVGGPAFVSTSDDGSYYPDFVVVAADGTHWLVEVKSDRNAGDADVVRKRHAGEDWARLVRDSGGFGVWRFLFVTESMLASAGGSWAALLAAAGPE